MGYVNIPVEPLAPGKVHVSMQLEPHEMRITIDRLKAVLEQLNTQVVGATANAADGRAQAMHSQESTATAWQAPLQTGLHQLTQAVPSQAVTQSPSLPGPPQSSAVTPASFSPFDRASSGTAPVAQDPVLKQRSETAVNFQPAPPIPSRPLTQPPPPPRPAGPPVPTWNPAPRPPPRATGPPIPTWDLPAAPAPHSRSHMDPPMPTWNPTPRPAAPADLAAQPGYRSFQAATVADTRPAEVPSFEGWEPVEARPPTMPAFNQPSRATQGRPPATNAAGWYRGYVSDRADHNNDPVEGMVFAENLPGMMGMADNATGWLVSCSRHQLVLWNSLDGSGDLPELLALHSQVTNFRSVALDLEAETQVLMAASSEGNGRECVSCHSLEPHRLFTPTLQLRLPTTPTATMRSQLHRQVVSLHTFRGPLSETCAASYDGNIVVLPTLQQNQQVVPKAKAEWKAHEGLIKVLHTAKPLQLWSADASGSIKMWSMKAKPTAPLIELRHGKSMVSGVNLPNENNLVSSGNDGQLMIWDLRKTNAPKRTVRVDGRPLLCLSVSPVVGDVAAVITAGGVYGVDLMDSSAVVTRISEETPGPHACRITWGGPSVLFAGRHDGSIAVYRRSM